MSLESLNNKVYDKLVAVIHFPTFNKKGEYSSFIDLFKEFNVDKVIYGHLHGKNAFKYALTGEHFGIEFMFTAIDYTDCKLIQVY
jgi:predicted phosphohydrolase